MQPARQTPRWEAKLSLDFATKNDKTIITNRKHHGPLVIQKPFYPEGNPCHVYLLHPPGGLVGGDQLILDVNLQNNSHALITTPGAAKFYRSAGDVASQIQHLDVANGALLEWLPQETIIFNQANSHVQTEVNLSTGAKFIGWEISCLGRQAGDLPFVEGQFVQKIQVTQNNSPLVIERALYRGNDPILSARWGLANQPTVGTMIITPADPELVNKIRQQVQAESPELFSVTLLDGVIICRYLGPQAAAAKQIFTRVWEIVRPVIQDIKVCIPRIWNT